jgi:hypothetical protein
VKNAFRPEDASAPWHPPTRPDGVSPEYTKEKERQTLLQHMTQAPQEHVSQVAA